MIYEVTKSTETTYDTDVTMATLVSAAEAMKEKGARFITITAKDINEARQVVGISIGGQKGGTPGRGFLWQDGFMFDLNELIDTASEHQVWGAVGINDAGQIAAGLRVRLKGNGRELGTGQAALIIPTPSSN